MRSSGPSSGEASESEARERILEAACHEFSHRGYEGTTMRQIAERAEVGHPLLNYYFGDKDGLWRAAAERLYGRVGRTLEQSLAEAAGLEDEVRIRHVLVQFVMIASESRLLTFLVETSQEGSERAKWLWDQWVQPVQERIHDLIVEGQELGLIVKASPDLVYQLLTGFSLADGARALFPGRGRPRRGARARVDELVSFLMQGDPNG